MAKNLLTGSLKNRSIDNLETQKKYISMKNFQFFNYLLSLVATSADSVPSSYLVRIMIVPIGITFGNLQ